MIAVSPSASFAASRKASRSARPASAAMETVARSSPIVTSNSNAAAKSIAVMSVVPTTCGPSPASSAAPASSPKSASTPASRLTAVASRSVRVRTPVAASNSTLATAPASSPTVASPNSSARPALIAATASPSVSSSASASSSVLTVPVAASVRVMRRSFRPAGVAPVMVAAVASNASAVSVEASVLGFSRMAERSMPKARPRLISGSTRSDPSPRASTRLVRMSATVAPRMSSS